MSAPFAAAKQVPDDAACQSGRHHAKRHICGVHEAGGDGSRHGQGRERADEVEQTRNRHRGPSAPVAIDVAIALPVSWKPFVKSKASAVMTTSASTVSFLTMATVNLG
jgi:hypothetical protein